MTDRLRDKAERLVDAALRFLAGPGPDEDERRAIAASAGRVLDLCGGPTVVFVYEGEEDE